MIWVYAVFKKMIYICHTNINILVSSKFRGINQKTRSVLSYKLAYTHPHI